MKIKHQIHQIPFVAVLTIICASVAVAKDETNTAVAVDASLHVSDASRLLIRPTRIGIVEQQVKRDAVVSLSEEQSRGQSGQVYRYLLSVTNGSSFSREITSPRHLSGFAVITADSAQNYLFWIDRQLLCFSKIIPTNSASSVPRTSGQTSAAQADHVINLGSFSGAEQFLGRRADNCELGIISLHEAGNEMTINATNIYGKTFTFTNSGSEWRIVSEK